MRPLLALDILPHSSFFLSVTCVCTYVYMVPTDARRRHHTISLELEQPSDHWECVRAANALGLCVPSLSSPFQISPLAGANALWQMVLQLPLSDFSLVPSILN